MNFYEIKKIVEFQSGYHTIKNLAQLALSTEDVTIKFMAKSILVQVYLDYDLDYKGIRKSSVFTSVFNHFQHFQIKIEKEHITTIITGFDDVKVFDFKIGISNNQRLFLVKNKLLILPSYAYYESQETFNLYVNVYKKLKELLEN